MTVAASLIGALGSLGFTIYTGRHNRSVLLITMFAIWVLSPFAALLWAEIKSHQFGPTLTLILSLAALTIYGIVALGPPRPQPATFFLMTPAASWFSIGIAAWMNRRPRA